ncbi:hypothetical protein RchiOBHm_Chr1g0344481 [Rosa chinensis]|uniref:Uncharacterized protein n=1 Tax=Rosa chinensis TaxID=74649 RepID=A0A2P6SEK4_ROSCH|nr:uncharacterized protein LOC112196631 [Rosa chinensis]PRQ57093.1 hypothetical protein RchiOBHm_Chr1g0344481 [Rosa chinensis]
MANQPYTRKHFQNNGEPPTNQETGITGASEHAVLYNEVSNSFWALLDWVISIWRVVFGRQRPGITVSDNRVRGNTGVCNGMLLVGNSTQDHARKTQISEDDKPEDDRKPCIDVSRNQIDDNNGFANGIFSVGNK